MSASHCSGKAGGIQCLHEYPIFHFSFQLHDYIALWTRLHVIPVICIIILPLNNRPEKNNLDRKFWKLERVAYLAMETDVDRDNVRWSIGNFKNPPGIWPSHVPGEGGVKVCGDTVLFDLWWWGSAWIFILSCGIAVFTKPSRLRYL